jgi:hypothetical protein
MQINVTHNIRYDCERFALDVDFIFVPLFCIFVWRKQRENKCRLPPSMRRSTIDAVCGLYPFQPQKLAWTQTVDVCPTIATLRIFHRYQEFCLCNVSFKQLDTILQLQVVTSLFGVEHPRKYIRITHLDWVRKEHSDRPVACCRGRVAHVSTCVPCVIHSRMGRQPVPRPQSDKAR